MADKKTVLIVGGMGAAVTLFALLSRNAQASPECSIDADCPEGYICVNGRCVTEGSPIAPSIQIAAAQNITESSASLSGLILGLGTATQIAVSFLWGVTSSCEMGETAAAILIEADAVLATIAGLEPATKYYFRMKAIGDGEAISNALSFTTLAAPPATDAPTLLSPADGATIDSITIAFEWSIPEGADSYWLDIKKIDGTVFFSEQVPDNITEVSGFQNNGAEYKWTVQAHTAAGWGAVSVEWTFTNDEIPPPVPPLLKSPDDSSAAEGISVILEWNLSPGANSYRLVANSDPDPTAGSLYADLNVGNVTSYELSGLTNNGQTIYWRVWAARDGEYGNPSETWSFLNAPGIENPFSVTTELASGISETGARLFATVNGLGGYLNARLSFQFGHTEDGLFWETAQIPITSTGQFHIDLADMPVGTPYYFRARLITGDPLLPTAEEYGDTLNFTTYGVQPPPLDAPELVYPQPGSLVPQESIGFEWEPVLGADHYQIIIRKSVDSSLKLNVDAGNVITRIDPGYANDGTPYKWRVVAGNNAGWGPTQEYSIFANGSSAMLARIINIESEYTWNYQSSGYNLTQMYAVIRNDGSPVTLNIDWAYIATDMNSALIPPTEYPTMEDINDPEWIWRWDFHGVFNEALYIPTGITHFKIYENAWIDIMSRFRFYVRLLQDDDWDIYWSQCSFVPDWTKTGILQTCPNDIY